MPTSRSLKRNAKAAPPPPRRRLVVCLVFIALLAVLIVTAILIPASQIARLLPPSIHADDFSGSLWHGSAGRITLEGKEAGAIEWHLHPGSLLNLTVSAQVHWVMVGFVADASADLDRHGLSARDVQGSGPIEDLRSVGIANGWKGAINFKFSEVRLAFDNGPLRVLAVVGELQVDNLSSPQIANGSDLGSYVLRLPSGAVKPGGDASAELADTGGPLQLQATVDFSSKDNTGILSGTLKERPEASAALRAQLENLTQLHARDAQGRIPVDLEITL